MNVAWKMSHPRLAAITMRFLAMTLLLLLLLVFTLGALAMSPDAAPIFTRKLNTRSGSPL